MGWGGPWVGEEQEEALTAVFAPQKRRRPTLGVQLDDKRKEMLKRHPLSVTLDLKCKGEGLWAVTAAQGLTPAAPQGPCGELEVWRGFSELEQAPMSLFLCGQMRMCFT